MNLNGKLCLSLNKYNQLLLKLAVAILLMGLAFRFLFFSSHEFFSPDLETAPAVAKSDVTEATPTDNFTIDVSAYEDQNLEPGKGNYFGFFQLGFCFYFYIACMMIMICLFCFSMLQSPMMRMRCLKKVRN